MKIEIDTPEACEMLAGVLSKALIERKGIVSFGKVMETYSTMKNEAGPNYYALLSIVWALVHETKDDNEVSDRLIRRARAVLEGGKS